MTPIPSSTKTDTKKVHLAGDESVQREAPQILAPGVGQANHELLMPETRRVPTMGDFLTQRRILHGNAQADQWGHELFIATQLNRGPPGAFASNNLHMEMLLGLDDRINFEHFRD